VTDSVAANGPELTWRGGATKKGKANLTTKDTIPEGNSPRIRHRTDQPQFLRLRR
jgi:hypothetical protein